MPSRDSDASTILLPVADCLRVSQRELSIQRMAKREFEYDAKGKTSILDVIGFLQARRCATGLR